MIRFDALEKSTEQNLLSSNEITSLDSTPIDESKSFWNDIFSKEANFLDEVFDCDEQDCKIDFDINNKDISNLLHEVKSNWEVLKDTGRMELCEKFVNVLSEILGLENIPDCKFYTNDENGNFGFFSKADNTININTYHFNNPSETINTLAHEIRHTFQNERASCGETYIDALYKCNLENYISLEFVDGYCVNFLDYYNQFVEVEARVFADMFKL